jgi:hypothetical protein
MMRRNVVLALVIALFSFAQSSSAAVALSDLIAGNDSFASGDLVFDQFSFTGLGGINNSIDINVHAINGSDGSPGIRFQGGFSDLPGNGPSGFTISYVVTAAGLIDHTTLLGNPIAILSGLGTMTSMLGGDTLKIFDNADTGMTDLLVSADLSSPATSFAVQLDFLAEAGGVGGVTASFVDQTFSGGGVVPEISSLGTWLTLMMGGVGFCLFNYYRKPETVKAKS